MGEFRRHVSIVGLGLFLLLSSCSPFASRKSPIVLILLESFSEQDYLCSTPRRLDGLRDLEAECEHFIRFTHTYAPSVLTQPSLASLVTAKEISEHGVINNGAHGISSRYQTLAESALNFKMRTGFFSGGVPLMQKFGISQGYETFLDSFQGKNDKFFIPLNQTVEQSLKWIDTEVQQRSFFLTIYAPDLLYEGIATRDNLDDERPVHRTSNLEEVYESINNLIRGLKKRKRWRNTNLIVLGVSGQRQSLHPLNPIGGTHLHVPLQIKLSENIDTNLKERTGEMVSFAKLGSWIQNLIFHKPSQGSLLFSPSHDEGFIPQQSTWKHWLGLTNWSVYGLRKRQHLFVYQPKLAVYDSFFDKREIEPLPPRESTLLASKYDISHQVQAFFPEHCQADINGKECPPKIVNKEAIRDISLILKWSEIVWDSEKPIDNMSQLVSKALRGKSEIVINWLAYHALYQKKWTSLFEMGQALKNKPWMVVAQANLRENPSFEPENCLKYFVGERQRIDNFYRVCQDSELRKVVEGINKLRQKKRPSDSFWAQVNEIKRMRRAKAINLKMLFINDVADPFNFAPKLSELYFFLPDNSEFQELINVNET